MTFSPIQICLPGIPPWLRRWWRSSVSSSALVAIIGLKLGLSSPIFATAFVFATIVIVDAIGLRNYLGQHGKTLNILVKDLKEDEFLDRSYPKLLERIGHTPLQVMIGALVGIITSALGFWLF